MGQRILVWDLPVRLFHWSLAATFTAAYLTAEEEQWHAVHLTCGYLFAALIAFRLVWGIIGSRHARFASFVRGPVAAISYLRSLFSGTPQHFAGHNPAGAIAIVLLLLLGAGIVASGWMTLNEIGGEAFEEVHEVVANAMLLLVFFHIAAVFISSHLHHENLTAAMFTGRKNGKEDEKISHSRGYIAVIMVVALGLFGVALTQGKVPALWDPNNPAHSAESGNEAGAEGNEQGGDHDKDDD